MRYKNKFILFVLLLTTHVWSQNQGAEIGLVTDNDLYTSSKNDMYYTNGMELFYRYLTKSENTKIHKKTTQFKVGQYIYTPRFLNSANKDIMDRPYAGYLFGEFGKTIFYTNQSVFQADLRLGYVGSNAFGKETQKSFHDLVGYKEVRGWEYQIQNALAVQTHFMFSKKIFAESHHDFVDLHFLSEASLGTIFNGASAGFVTRIGFKKLVAVYNSNLYGGAVGSNEREFFLYIAPSINYQLYDATIQGSLFNNNSPVTFSLVPFRFNGEAGFKYRKNKLNLSYVFVYRGKELYSSTISGYFYGSIGISYLIQ
jgi:hypothetical protein